MSLAAGRPNAAPNLSCRLATCLARRAAGGDARRLAGNALP